MNEHTMRIVEWLQRRPDVQSYVRPVGNLPLAERARMLRTAASDARPELMGVDFDAVDWEGVVRDLDSD
jgi:hypothetical protein